MLILLIMYFIDYSCAIIDRISVTRAAFGGLVTLQGWKYSTDFFFYCFLWLENMLKKHKTPYFTQQGLILTMDAEISVFFVYVQSHPWTPDEQFSHRYFQYVGLLLINGCLKVLIFPVLTHTQILPIILKIYNIFAL